MRRALPTLLAAVTLTIAGCGSSSLPDRDLRAAATAMCKHATSRLNGLAQPSSPNAALPFLRRGVAVLGPELSALRRLAPSSGLSSRYASTLAQLATAVGRVRATVALLQRGGDPVGAFGALEQQLSPILASENAGWIALQIPACVNR